MRNFKASNRIVSLLIVIERTRGFYYKIKRVFIKAKYTHLVVTNTSKMIHKKIVYFPFVFFQY
jgi:hypothetical protein